MRALLSRVVVILCLLPAGCGVDELAEDSGSEDTGGSELESSIAPGSIRWVLDWDPGEAALLESGWTTVNDLGYTITVEAAWISSWGATLIPCSEDQAEAEARVADDALALASPGLVARGHTTGSDDVSAEVFDLIESATELAGTQRDPHDLGGASYCSAHYLLAPISEFSDGVEQATAALAQVDPALELLGASALIVGSFSHPSGAAGPFVIRSEQAYGKILTLELEDPLDADAASVDLVVRRRLDRIFDGVDFELGDAEDAEDAEDAAWTVLGNLARGSSVEARASE